MTEVVRLLLELEEARERQAQEEAMTRLMEVQEAIREAKAKQKAQEARKALERIPERIAEVRPKVDKPKPPKSRMSAAGRRAIAEAQRKRWAKVKAAPKRLKRIPRRKK